jgi:hypothetical protein
MKEICDEQQEILMRTTYSRTAFQNATENTVRISLDTNLCMTREQGLPDGRIVVPRPRVHVRCTRTKSPSSRTVWSRSSSRQSPPQWVRDLVNSGMLLMVPKFSKFLHGTAALYQHITENVPYWFLPDPRDKELLTPATWDEMADTECIYAKDAADWLFPKELRARRLTKSDICLCPSSGLRGAGRNSRALAAAARGNYGDGTSGRPRDPSAREAMLELEDESGNRTWCDVETVEEAAVGSASSLAGAGDSLTAARRPPCRSARPETVVDRIPVGR